MSYKPFPIGTIRGPYTCGLANDPSGGIQYTVKGENGWVYFIKHRRLERECLKEAREFAKKIK